jgi:alpha-ribazole phosphatase
MRLYLVRHPEPIACHGICYGRMDLEVDPAHLRAVTDDVKVHLPSLISPAFFSSPARRCQSLARELAAGAPIDTSEDLREMDFGSWEGIPWSQIPREQLHAWTNDLWGYKPGGGESVAMLEQRWQRWLKPKAAAGLQEAVVVTHAGIIRVALVAAGRIPKHQVTALSIDFGSVHPVDVDP